MKRLLLPLLAALALPTAVNAEVEVSENIHNRCKDAKDYVGCVQIMTGEKSIGSGDGTGGGTTGGGSGGATLVPADPP